MENLETVEPYHDDPEESQPEQKEEFKHIHREVEVYHRKPKIPKFWIAIGAIIVIAFVIMMLTKGSFLSENIKISDKIADKSQAAPEAEAEPSENPDTPVEEPAEG